MTRCRHIKIARKIGLHIRHRLTPVSLRNIFCRVYSSAYRRDRLIIGRYNLRRKMEACNSRASRLLVGICCMSLETYVKLYFDCLPYSSGKSDNDAVLDHWCRFQIHMFEKWVLLELYRFLGAQIVHIRWNSCHETHYRKWAYAFNPFDGWCKSRS